MRLYSDTLTGGDLYAAVPDGCTLDTIAIGRPRTRKHGWQARLTRPGSNRRTNTGTHGAGEERAATYQDHGVWMARLFEIDPDAKITQYDGREDFERQTRKATEWGPRYAAPWLTEVPA